MNGYAVDTQANSTAVRVDWWQAEEGRAHELIFPLVGRLINQDSVRRRSVLRLLKMAGNYSHTGLGHSQEMDPSRLRYNLIGQAADTLISEVTMSDPKASFQATDSPWLLRQAAKEQEALCEAQMRELKWWSETAPRCLKDALLAGTGLAYPYLDRGNVCIERVPPLEWLVEEADAHYGDPRMGFRRKAVDRQVLAAACPEYADQIRDPRKVQRFQVVGDDEWLLKDTTQGDLVLVVSAWRLPTAKDADDGWHVVCVPGLDIYKAPYKRDRYPVVAMRSKAADVGWWGRSMAEDIYPDQIELNRTLMSIQESFKSAAGMMLVPREAKIKLRHLTDIPGACVEYSGGMKPEYYAPSTVNGEQYAHADRIISRALSRLGINEMATAAQKPAGLTSGEAIRSYRDQFSMRQNPLAKMYEAATVEMAQMLDLLNRELYAQVSTGDDGKMPSYPVAVTRGRRKMYKRLRWEETDKPENRFLIQAFSINGLTSSPAGKEALIGEWASRGLLTPEQEKRLTGMPAGLDEEIRLDVADYDFAMYAYDTMVLDGEYVPPEPYQAPFEKPIELMRRAYLVGVMDDVPDSRLELVRKHMSALKALADKAKLGAQSQQQMAAPQAPVQQPAPDLSGMTEIQPGIAA